MTAGHSVRLALGLVPLIFALACMPGYFRQRAIENDIAQMTQDIRRIYQVNGDTQQLVQTRLTDLETKRRSDSELILRRLADMDQRIMALHEQMDIVRGQLEEVRYRTTGESPDRIPIHVGTGDEASTLVLEGEQLFSEGGVALRRGDYAGARAAFGEFLKQFPTSSRAVDARMWIAESHYREEDWPAAREAFAMVEQRYPASSRVPEALYKMALCDEELGNPALAAETLQRLVGKYPDWEMIERAKDMLDRLIKVEPQVPPAATP
jgi:tol-pal system protein YbgF